VGMVLRVVGMVLRVFGMVRRIVGIVHRFAVSMDLICIALTVPRSVLALSPQRLFWTDELVNSVAYDAINSMTFEVFDVVVIVVVVAPAEYQEAGPFGLGDPGSVSQ